MRPQPPRAAGSRPSLDPWRRGLEAVNRIPGVAGALLVSREGTCVLNACGGLRSPDVVAAMGAAVLSASETMADEMGLGRRARFHVRTEGRSLLGLSATEDLMLLALLLPAADPDAAAGRVEAVLAVAAREAQE